MNNTEDISTKLTKAIYEWRARTNETPSAIYLGNKEHNALVEIAKMFSPHAYSPSTNPDDRMRFQGVPVFAVDAASHIRFGWDGPSPCG